MAINNVHMFPILPGEIVEYEILVRLPVKSLLRFKLVCKSWKLLISRDLDFIKAHQVRNSSINSLILRSKYKKKIGSMSINDFIYDYTTIIGCINGLVCIFHNSIVSESMRLTIWNPATKQCFDVNAPLRDLPSTLRITDFFGFGFNSVTNDFKVMYVSTAQEEPITGYIGSMGALLWKKVAPSNFLYHGTLLNYGQAAIVDGSPYWLNEHHDVIPHLTVICFDVRLEVIRLLPDSIDKETGKDVILMNFRDSVAVMFYHQISFTAMGTPLNIHVFDDRCSVWNKMSIGPFISKEPALNPGLKFITCLRNGDMLFGGPDLKLYSTNPETQTFKSLESPGQEMKDKYAHYYDGGTYSESLIFLKGMKPLYNKKDVDFFSLRKI